MFEEILLVFGVGVGLLCWFELMQIRRKLAKIEKKN